MRAKKRTAWAMIDKKGYIFPNFIRDTKKDVIALIEADGLIKWANWKKVDQRDVVKISIQGVN